MGQNDYSTMHTKSKKVHHPKIHDFCIVTLYEFRRWIITLTHSYVFTLKSISTLNNCEQIIRLEISVSSCVLIVHNFILLSAIRTTIIDEQ